MWSAHRNMSSERSHASDPTQTNAAHKEEEQHTRTQYIFIFPAFIFTSRINIYTQIQFHIQTLLLLPINLVQCSLSRKKKLSPLCTCIAAAKLSSARRDPVATQAHIKRRQISSPCALDPRAVSNFPTYVRVRWRQT